MVTVNRRIRTRQRPAPVPSPAEEDGFELPPLLELSEEEGRAFFRPRSAPDGRPVRRGVPAPLRPRRLRRDRGRRVRPGRGRAELSCPLWAITRHRFAPNSRRLPRRLASPSVPSPTPDCCQAKRAGGTTVRLRPRPRRHFRPLARCAGPHSPSGFLFGPIRSRGLRSRATPAVSSNETVGNSWCSTGIQIRLCLPPLSPTSTSRPS